MLPRRSHARFYADDKVFTWDYQWQAWTLATAVGTEFDDIRDAIAWNGGSVGQGSPLFLQGNGTVRQEVPGTSHDTSSVFLPMRVKLGFASLAGIRGFQSLMAVQVIGRMRSAATVTARLYMDGSATSEAPYTFDLTGSPDPVTFEVRPKKRRCSSFAIELVDSLGTGAVSPGMTIEAVSLLVGVNPKLARMPFAKRATRVP